MQIKLAWSVFWRVMIFQFVLSFIITIASIRMSWFSDPTMFFLKPSIIWIIGAVALLVAQVTMPNGLLYLMGGRNLVQPSQFWRGLGFTLSGLWLALALLNIGMAKLVSFELWMTLKAFAPFVILLIYVLVVPARLSTRAQLKS